MRRLGSFLARRAGSRPWGQFAFFRSRALAAAAALLRKENRLSPVFFAGLEHPSSDLASLGHLLPQGEKVKRDILAAANLKRSRLMSRLMRASPPPFVGEGVERSETEEGCSSLLRRGSITTLLAFTLSSAALADDTPAGLATDAHRPRPERPRTRSGHYQTRHRLLQAEILRASSRRRGDVEEKSEPGRLLAILRQHHLRAGRHVQARQRAVPESLGVVSILHAGVRRARPPVQCPRLSELPSEGWARPSAGGQRRRDHHVLPAGSCGRNRRGEAGGRRAKSAELSRPDLWRPIAGPCGARPFRRR